MANINLDDFKVGKLYNADAERNYVNDILHAIVAKLSDLETAISSITGGGSSTSASYVTALPETTLAGSRVLRGEANVINIADGGSSSTVGVATGGISTVKLADASVTIPKIGATGTADSTTYLRGDGVWGDPSSTYTFPQSIPATTWTITHNLNRFPSVTVVDSAGTFVIGQLVYDSSNQCTLTFSAAFSGKAYLN